MVVMTDNDIDDQIGLDRVISGDQMQPAGIDLTVKSIEIFDEDGAIDFSNDLRRLPRCTALNWEDYKHEGEDSIQLAPGSYRIQVDPIVEIPQDVVAFCLPRSSLTRMGCSINGGLFDPGYKGDGVLLLTVHNRLGVTIYRNARVAQMVFVKTSGNSDAQYEGTYQGHGIEE